MELQIALAQALDVHRDAVLTFCQDLVRIASENPPGNHYREDRARCTGGWQLNSARSQTRARCRPNHFCGSNQVFSNLNPETQSIRSTICSVYL